MFLRKFVSIGIASQKYLFFAVLSKLQKQVLKFLTLLVFHELCTLQLFIRIKTMP